MIVDLLRGGKENAILNQGGPMAAPSPKIAPANVGAGEFAAAAQHLSDPMYTAYKREAQASGEPVMSLEEFKKARSR